MTTRYSVGAYRLILSHLSLTRVQLLDRSWVPEVSLSRYFRRRVRPSVYFLQRCLTGDAGWEGPVLDLTPVDLQEIQYHLVILLATVVRFFCLNFRHGCIISLISSYLGFMNCLRGFSSNVQRLLGRSRFWALERIRSGELHPTAVLREAAFYAIPAEASQLFTILLRLMNISRVGEAHIVPVSVARPIVIELWLAASANATASARPEDYPEYDAVGLLHPQEAPFVFPPPE